MRLGTKIAAVFLLPLLAFALQSARSYRDARDEHDVAESMQSSIACLDSLSALVHELQKERGISSLFASGGGPISMVESQRSATNTKMAGFAKALELSGYHDSVLREGSDALDTLPGLRNSTDRKSEPAQIRAGYTALIRRILNIYRAGIDGKTTKGLGKLITTLAILEEAKEATGRLRALTSSIVTIDRPLALEQLKQMLELHATMEGNLRSPALSLSTDGAQALNAMEKSESVRETERIFWAVMQRQDSGGYSVDGKECFDVFTRRIDLMQDMLRPEFSRLQARSQGIHDSNQRRQYLALGSGILLGACMCWFSWIAISGLLRRLGELDRLASALADGKIVDVDIRQGGDEIDALTRSLGMMVDRIRTLLEGMEAMAMAHDLGDIDVRVQSDGLEGAYASVASQVNGMVNGHIAVKKKAMACVAEFGKGNFDAPLEKFPGKKAFINETIEVLRSNLKAISVQVNDLIEASKAGRLDTRGDARKFQGDWSKLVGGVNEMLDAILLPIQEAAQVLDKVAARDLTARVAGAYQGDHAKIKNALNLAVENLETAMGQVQEATQQVASASGQISSGSQSLAQGANEQASSLEEVSASLEEMSSMTRQNADNALAAKNLAGEADLHAKTGTEAMERMSSAINKIKESSDQTAKIVKTIDEIAMQTNLLALNAAVEAARAGEAGRGFAVVAEEVRNLAQRSAQAAKNTADMIGESVKNAGDGVKISDEVSVSFEKIATSSKKVNDLIAEIAAASKEQAQGIKEVNDAISQMDKVTQQNAANAEESASASEELSGQAQELRSMVAGFRIGASAALDRRP